jgi:hypothetical protein
MNDIFGNAEEEQLPEGEQQPEQAQEVATPEQTEVIEAVPPAAESEKHVPLKALEAERAGRREWRDKYHQLEGELRALKQQAQFQQPQQAQEQQIYDPAQHAIEAANNARLDTSEMLAREKFGDEEVDKAFAKFQDQLGKDPLLLQRAMRDKHPWGFIVRETKRMELLAEVGDDPAAYKAKLRAEILAESGQQPAITTPKPVLPPSLATARSSGARSTNWTGPPPLSDIFG